MHRLIAHGSLAALIAVAALGLVWPQNAAAYPNEPTGFGKATFGTTIGKLKKLYPKAKLTHHTSSDPSEGISVFALEDQPMLGLGPCSMNFLFGHGQLYQIEFRCKKRDQVVKALHKKYGEPNMNRGSSGVFWYGDKTVISLNPKSNAFGFIDRARNQEIQHELLAAVLAGGIKTPTPGSAAPTPAPTSK